MTDEQLRDELRLAAKIAEQILEKADNGIKLFSLTRHYPVGRAAFKYGFVVACGAASGLSFMATVGWLISKVLS